MKNMYLVTIRGADREALVNILDAVEGKAANVEISVLAPTESVAEGIRFKPSAPRRGPKGGKRGSKVNAAILSAMSNAPASIQDMKAALSQAGMAPSSLSTGLAILTKSGQIERVGEGLYGLKVMKAAE